MGERHTFEKIVRKGLTKSIHQECENILDYCFEGKALKEAAESSITPSHNMLG
jgi:hypothetical protein